MDEFLIANQKKDINSPLNSVSSFNNISSYNGLLCDNDTTYERLKFIGRTSCCKKTLAKILARIYKYQLLIIIFSFILGFLFLALPFIFIFINLLNNKCFPLFITCLFGIIFSILTITIICIDSKRYQFLASAKWNRKSILKNIANLILFLLLTVSVSFMVIFYHDIVIDKSKKLRFDYNGQDKSGNSYELSSDFIFKYILYILLYDDNRINDIKNIKIKIIFDNWDLDNIRKSFMFICIPIVVISFFSIIKIFLIDVRQTIEKAIFSGGIFVLSFFYFYIDSTAIEKLIGKNLDICALFQNVVIIFILLGYIFWTINYTIGLIKKRKDNNFAIRKYDKSNIIIIIIIDVITCLGYVIITISIIYCYISFNYQEETFYYLNISFSIFKIGFFLVIIGNSYYFGYYFLAMIFRPIAEEFAPYQYKNGFYIRAKRNLQNYTAAKRRKKLNKDKLKRALSDQDS